MIERSQRMKRGSARALACRLAVVASLIGLAGCSGTDGIQLEGKVFEVVGLTSALGPKVEPKAEARAPLVLPPSGRTLSPPGEVAAAPVAPPAANPAWPQDPDQQRVASADRKKAEQDKFCKDGNWRESAMGDDMAANAGPHGRCTGSIFDVLGKSLFGQ